MIEAEKATYTVKQMWRHWSFTLGCLHGANPRGEPSPSQQRRAELDAQVAVFHAASDGVYGAPRILADLRASQRSVSRKTWRPRCTAKPFQSPARLPGHYVGRP